jgi:hypothetical protein
MLKEYGVRLADNLHPILYSLRTRLTFPAIKGSQPSLQLLREGRGSHNGPEVCPSSCHGVDAETWEHPVHGPRSYADGIACLMFDVVCPHFHPH